MWTKSRSAGEISDVTVREMGTCSSSVRPAEEDDRVVIKTIKRKSTVP